MDFIVGIPKLDDKLVTVVVVYQISKYAHFCALQNPFTMAMVAQLFLDHIFKLHGHAYLHCVRLRSHIY